jgi:glycosyltransferase involved in cell wall biosynthesis
MTVLCVNSVISDYGGVEFAAMNLAFGLAQRGHSIHFLGTKGHGPQVGLPALSGGNSEPTWHEMINCHYEEFPRTYPLHEKHWLPRKLLWHLQDLAHPANEAIFEEVLRRVRPDIIILHSITAIGLNIWRSIRKSEIPCIQVIHDLSLICLQAACFRKGHQCRGLCMACRIQKKIRFSWIYEAPNFAFVSPSHASLREIERYVDLSRWRRKIISNPNTFNVEPRDLSLLEKPRLLYVGRLDPSKGVDMMLRAAQLARNTVEFDLDILGAGVLEQPLRQKYSQSRWVKFRGSVDQKTVAEYMSRATVLLVPSLWLETVPGVVVHALFAGLPVLGSRIGGIPEHVTDGRTGRLLPPGDEQMWSEEIARVVTNRAQAVAWSAECQEAAQRFAPRLALDEYERLMHEMMTVA